MLSNTNTQAWFVGASKFVEREEKRSAERSFVHCIMLCNIYAQSNIDFGLVCTYMGYSNFCVYMSFYSRSSYFNNVYLVDRGR